MESIQVRINNEPLEYPFWVGSGLIPRLPEIISQRNYSRIACVIDSAVAKNWGGHIIDMLNLPVNAMLSLPGEESIKCTSNLEKLWRFFFEQKIDRHSLIISVGGGSILDLSGFAAATFMRGVPFAALPTTLLSQVDASIGGKNGLNSFGIKNLVGTIAHPVCVVADIDFLASLPPREMHAGFAEIFKHGLIADKTFAHAIAELSPEECSKSDLEKIVRRSIEIKRAIVEQDPTEKGLRKLLNFGHTFGHAVEIFSHEFGCPFQHGEAVAIGMIAESFISFQLKRISKADLDFVIQGIQNLGLPIHLNFEIHCAQLMDLISRDKKNKGDDIKWTLLDSIGKGAYDVDFPDQLVVNALQFIMSK